MWRALWQFVIICTHLTNEFLAKNGPHLSAGVTYYFLFSLLPLTLAVSAILGYFIRDTDLHGTPIVTVITSFLPVSKNAAAENLEIISRSSPITGIVGIIGLLWVSTTVFGGIRKGINAVWGISKPRPFFHERFIDISITTGAGILLLAPLVLTVTIGLLSGVGEEPTSSTFFQQTVRTIVTYLSPAASILVFMILYRYLPNTKVTFREVWPGALMAALAFEAAKWGFLWYTSSFPVLYNVFYGPLGALIALLIWVFISANILFYGALVTSRYSRHLSRKAEEKSLQLLTNFKHLTTPPARDE